MSRAIAILLIVGAHCHSISDINGDNFIHRLLMNITAGGTTVFVFLSGFLYHHIFYLKGRTKIFLKKRAQRLLVPYLILSIIPIAYRMYAQPDFWSIYIDSEKTGVFNDYIYPIFLFLISGDHLVAYWYISFAMVLFLCYPLHTMFIKANHKTQVFIFVASFSISLIVQRPYPLSLLFIQSLIYLTPAYLFGIYCSVYKERIYSLFRAKEYLFLFPFLLILLVQTYLGIEGNNAKALFSYEGIDSMLPQKIFLSLFLMVWLHRFESFENKYITLLANTSFAIYFLHGYVLRVLFILKERLEIVEFSQPVLVFFISLILLILISLLLAITIKKVLKDKSSYITGY
tara:strand:- start:4685 stop:5716 length:1032 start_codon:yes stop_codon:yes gene_type:complete